MNEKKFQVGSKGIFVEDNKVLFLKSFFSTTGEPYWDLPGGRLHAADKDVFAGLHRELLEELPGITNIQIGELLSAGIMPRPFPDGSGLFGVFYRVTANIPNPIVLTEEHTEYHWLTRDELQKVYKDTQRTDIFDEPFYFAALKALPRVT